MEKNKDSQVKALEILKKADPKLIQKFIASKIKTNEAFAEELIAFLDQSTKSNNIKSTPQEFEKLFAKDLKELKDTLKKSVNPRTDSIDYKPRSPLNKLVIKSLNMIRSQAPTIVLRIRYQLQVLGLLINEDIEPSGDAYDDMLQSIIEDLKGTLKNEEAAEREIIFNECMKFLRNNEYLGYEGEEVENFVLESFDNDFKPEIIDYVNWRIRLLTTKRDIRWNRDTDLGIYVEIMLGIMYRNGASEAQLNEFAKDFWEIPDVRQWFIWYFKETSQWDKGIRLAQESILLDQNKSSNVALYKSWLKDLYRLSGQTERYKDMLITIIRDSDKAEINAYKELKSLFSPEDWAQYRDRIFVWKKDDDWIRAQYLAEDNLKDRLALLILSPNTDYSLFNEYAAVLPKNYNARILSKYETYFSQLALCATSRKDYQNVLSRLKDAYKIQGAMN